MAITADTASPPSGSRRVGDRAVGIWLLVCCAMLLGIVTIGGLTRLTDSGLSITEWRPVTGVLPPLSAADWQSEFERYQQIPEYQEINRGMTLAEFKGIYWWEYVHRLWARLIGVVFAVPLLVFWIRGQIRRPLVPHLIAMFVLGGLQGALGWYMVKSGLSVRTDVSQYRLAAHFLAALAVYSYMLWIALTLLRPAPSGASTAAPLRGHLRLVVALLLLTLAFGAFVAGLDGGAVYNDSFPLMGGQLIPSDAFQSGSSPFDDPVTAQLIHRWLAILVVALIIALWLRRRRVSSGTHRPIDLLAAMALVQAGLGIATLLLEVPIPLAAAHQAGAIVLWTLALWSLHAAR
jgi:cytochrome c oxidase assembly protein subunit 15